MDDGDDVKDEGDDATVEESKQALEEGDAMSPPRAGKTEAELRHEEHRRKRVRCFQVLLLCICSHGELG